MTIVQHLLALNRRLSALLDRAWPYPLAGTFWQDYVTEAASQAALARPARIVDVGAGRETPYATHVPDGTELIGVDVLADDMEANTALDRRVVCDLMADGLPAEVHGAGLMTSRMVLEHLPDLGRFARDAYAGTAPGGRSLHLFAGRYSLFAVLNRVLPEDVSRRVLFALRPESAEVGGFVTYYDRTNAGAARQAFRDAGFVDVETRVSYQVSQYLNFLFPLFVLGRLWETALHAARAEDLGAFVLLSARRPEDAGR